MQTCLYVTSFCYVKRNIVKFEFERIFKYYIKTKHITCVTNLAIPLLLLIQLIPLSIGICNRI